MYLLLLAIVDRVLMPSQIVGSREHDVASLPRRRVKIFALY